MVALINDLLTYLQNAIGQNVLWIKNFRHMVQLYRNIKQILYATLKISKADETTGLDFKKLLFSIGGLHRKR